jgi:large subunit ribosomal protein L9e
MKVLLTEETVEIPEGCSVTCDGKSITVKGTRGTESLDISHMVLTVDIEEARLYVRLWNAPRKNTCIVKTCASSIRNLVLGCTKGFCYRMKAIYRHFPITMVVENGGRRVVVKNFLGHKRDRAIDMIGNTVAKLAEEKDHILIQGTSIQHVSQSAANISQRCIPKNKDLRIFLDGTFVVGKGLIEA